MESPVIAAKKPIKVELTEGETTYWCRCGKSANQPYCDGAHVGTEFEPMAYTAEQTGPAYLCQCKQSDNAPFCNGAHAKL